MKQQKKSEKKLACDEEENTDAVYSKEARIGTVEM